MITKRQRERQRQTADRISKVEKGLANTVAKTSALIDGLDLRFHEGLSNGLRDALSSVERAIQRAERQAEKRAKALAAALAQYRENVVTCQNQYFSLARALGDTVQSLITNPPSSTGDDPSVTPTDDFAAALYNAINNSSICKWTRAHVAVIKTIKSELESCESKIEKLRERAKGNTPESNAAQVLLDRQIAARDVCVRRMDFVLRKFLQIRNQALKRMVGATESIYTVFGDRIPVGVISRYPAQGICYELVECDANHDKGRGKR